jgi:hypothetical protein
MTYTAKTVVRKGGREKKEGIESKAGFREYPPENTDFNFIRGSTE